MLTFSQRQCDTDPRVTDETWDHGIPLHIELNLLTVDRDVIISDICSSMPLSNVQTLSVSRPWFSPAFWRQILRQLQDVQYIKLSEGNMPDLSVLSLTDHTTRDSGGEDVQGHGGLPSGDRGQSHILAPRLEELELKRITFLPDNGYNLPKCAITRSCLLDALSTRRGSPGRLTITPGYIPGSGVFDMAAVWGDDGFHVVSENVYPQRIAWEQEEEEEGAHSPEVESDSDLDEEEEVCVHSFEGEEGEEGEEGDASDWGDGMGDSGYSDDG